MMRLRNRECIEHVMPYERPHRNHRVLARYLGRTSCERNVKLEQRVKDEFESAIAETLDGRVSCDYSFAVRDSMVVAEDGEPLEIMLMRAIYMADELSKKDDYYAEFLPHRARNELAELYAIQEMISNPRDHNTVITISPYSEEFDNNDGKLNNAFQRPDCKRAMLRLSYWDGNRVHFITRSLDFASVSLLKESMRSALGITYASNDSTSMQGEFKLSSFDSIEDVINIADCIVESYDEILSELLGVETKQGRSVEESVELLSFVRNNLQDVTQSYVHEAINIKNKGLEAQKERSSIEQLLYSYIALSKQIKDGHIHATSDHISAMAESAGNNARENGEAYNVCGIIVGAQNSAQTLSIQTGFESLMLLSGKKQTCPNCRHSVVVEDSLLKIGILHCHKCDHTVDVCGDQQKAHRYKNILSKIRKKNTHNSKSKSDNVPRSFFGMLLFSK